MEGERERERGGLVAEGAHQPRGQHVRQFVPRLHYRRGKPERVVSLAFALTQTCFLITGRSSFFVNEA